tara:strand:- start:115 stop:618 length:504 start_codon:yes stop_codon:yes gene_type:complete
MEDKKQKVIDYINEVISQPRPEFGGMPVCPFAKPELDKDRLMIDIINENQSLDLLLDKYKNSKYNSALLILELPDGEVLTTEETRQFQVFVNRTMRLKGYKDIQTICFNPNDSVSINGFNPRGKAPYFLINIAGREELSKAHMSLTKTSYYDNMDVKYKSFLKIGGK